MFTNFQDFPRLSGNPERPKYVDAYIEKLFVFMDTVKLQMSWPPIENEAFWERIVQQSRGQQIFASAALKVALRQRLDDLNNHSLAVDNLQG